MIARLNVGGPSIQAVRLNERLALMGHETLLVHGKVGRAEGDMTYLTDAQNLNRQVIEHLGREISFASDFKTLIALIRVVRKFKPHVIHTHTAKAGTLGRLAGLTVNFFSRSTSKIKLVHTFHGHVFEGYFSPLKSKVFVWIERVLARFTDRIIAISALQKEDLCGKYRIAEPQKVRIISLGFDLKPFSDPDHEKKRENIRAFYFSGSHSDTLWLGIVGRLTPIKNHYMFMKAVRYLKDHDCASYYRNLIIGGGELYPELTRLTGELEISETVAFTGWQRDMAPFYNALDVIALTSKNEGTPVTLIEAMAAGKPVVATEVGGVRDLMGPVVEQHAEGFTLHQNGILVPSEQFEVFAKALVFIFHNRETARQTAARAQRFVLQHYSEQRLLHDIDALYRELI